MSVGLGEALLGTTAGVALLHTLLGIDHSLPFVALARSRGWSLRRTLVITAGCGLVHVLSSVLLGTIGIAAGVGLERLTGIEELRGDLASALLILFGLTYAAWGFLQTRRKRRSAAPSSGGGKGNTGLEAGQSLTVWGLFIVFAFGPCEPLIPLMVVPALADSWLLVGAICGLFGVLTVGTMLVTVAVCFVGIPEGRWGLFEEHGHAIAGLMIAATGLAVPVLGI